MTAGSRPRRHLRAVDGTAERDARLAADHAHDRFLCETCGQFHPLHEHKTCREGT